MLIDWFTVGAQVVNFLVLVWLLKRFLYKPILAAIAAREKGIAGQLSDAEAKKSDAQKQRDNFENKNKEFDQQRAALMEKAEDEAKAERAGLIETAHKDANDARIAQGVSLQVEQSKFADELTRIAKEQVFAVVRKTLHDLAGASLEDQMEAVFVERIRALSGDAKATMRAALTSSLSPSVVRSAFDLSVAQQDAIQTALNETFSANLPVRFETVKELGCGIELTGAGQKLEWNIAVYLNDLGHAVDGAINEKIAQQIHALQSSENDSAPKTDKVEDASQNAATAPALVAAGAH